MINFGPDVVKARVSSATIFSHIDHVPTIPGFDSPNSAATQPDDAKKGSFSLSNVKFTYPSRPSRPVLLGTTIAARPGQKVAIVGRSGGGKSTITELLLRFYDPAAGKVSIGGIDAVKWSPSNLRRQFGIVQQEPVLFDFSIANNITYGSSAQVITRDRVVAAARTANIHEFIESLPEGYDTLVGEGGNLLSGGQKQRIALARAVFANPDILILDEVCIATYLAELEIVLSFGSCGNNSPALLLLPSGNISAGR